MTDDIKKLLLGAAPVERFILVALLMLGGTEALMPAAPVEPVAPPMMDDLRVLCEEAIRAECACPPAVKKLRRPPNPEATITDAGATDD